MKKLLLLTLIVILANFMSFGQDNIIENVIKNSKNEVSVVKFVENKFNAPSESSMMFIKKYFNVSDQYDFRIKSVFKDETALEHIRYIVYYKNIQVDESEVIVHQRGGQIILINGEIPIINLNNIVPSISKEDAINKATNFINSPKYAWQDSINELWIKDHNNNKNSTFFPKPELVIFTNSDDNLAHLAFKMHIVTLSPLGNYTVYIDAVNGNVLKTTNYIDASNAVGTAYTKYSGTVSLNTDSYSGGFRLYDGTRGQGIETKNAQKTNDPWNAIAFSDNNNNWTVAEFHNQNMDDAALDAHYCAQKTYDFFKNVLLRNSYDSNNAKVSLYAHYTTLPNHLGWNDAIWIRTLNFMALGDGDGVICSPLTSCDVYNTPHFLYQRYCLLS